MDRNASKCEDLRLWRLFCEAAKSGGVNAACDTLQCEPSKVSRAIKTLEAEIGAPLFLREGRNLRLTELGARAQRMADDLLRRHSRMVLDLQGDRDALRGSVRIVAHAGIVPLEIAPTLVEFLKTYPDIEPQLSDIQGLPPAIFEGPDAPDIAASYGPEAPIPGLVCRYVGQMPFIACASPLYLARHKAPRHPLDLIEHTGLISQPPSRTPTESLEKNGQSIELHWKRTVAFRSVTAARSAVLLGAGILPDMPLFHCASALRAGQLVQVLPGWRRKPAFCYVYASERAYEKRRVRLLMDWVVDQESRMLTRLREENPEYF